MSDDIRPVKAHPLLHQVINSDGTHLLMGYHNEGMDLRDWFAGQALAGLLSNREAYTAKVTTLAAWAYEQADAMMLARENNQQQKGKE